MLERIAIKYFHIFRNWLLTEEQIICDIQAKGSDMLLST
jgi:hypothetical protein